MKASIIIPSYNASERLYYNLLSLNMQSCDREIFEVIVVDDGSKDGTKEMLAGFNADFELRPIILKENQGRANARNCAIDKAKGDILIFHDSDMLAENDFIKKHIETHESAGTVVSGMNWGRIFTYYYKNFAGISEENLKKQLEKMGVEMQFAHQQPIITEKDIVNGKCFEYTFWQTNYQNTENSIVQSYGNRLEGYFFPWSLFVTNNCSAYKRDIIEAGSFDNSFRTWGCEDLDLGYRLYKKGCQFIKAAHITSIHQEHPVSPHQDVSNNIYQFTDKYNSIDILLYYYGSCASINRYRANIILQELEEIKEDNSYAWFVELYRKLLVNLRDSSCFAGRGKYIDERKEIKQIVTSGLEDLPIILNGLETEKVLPTLADSFRTLLKKAMGPGYRNIKI